MYLSCASVCYRGYAKDEVQAMLEHAPKAGFKVVDVHGPLTWSPPAIDALDAHALRKRIEDAGLKCAGIYTPGFGGANQEQIETHARAIAKATFLCAILGGEHVVSTGAVARQGKATKGQHDISSVITCVQRIVELLPPDNKIKIGLEPHYGNIIKQMEDYERIFSAIDHPLIGICVDTGHFHSAKVDTVGLIRKFSDKIYDVHLKDHIGAQSVSIGHGEVDLPAIFGALKEISYNSSITLELEVKDVENAPKYVEEAYDIMAKLIQ
ncbi:sugar phosphate isomerase/epimerase [Candidatus Poribacteria bacterium]|nr:sugar phosphate isomerase/epimerase [Candidatus Poribacteria bacterium]